MISKVQNGTTANPFPQPFPLASADTLTPKLTLLNMLGMQNSHVFLIDSFG
jgi:hypothetical protein